MRASARLFVEAGSPQRAQVLWDAVSADDPGSVEGRVEGDRLVITAGPAPGPSLRVTLDDVLACLQAASGAATTPREGDDGDGCGEQGVG